MPLARYVKAVYVQNQRAVFGASETRPFLWKAIPNVFIVVGATVLTMVALPFFNYFLTANRWQRQAFLSPVTEIEMAQARGLISPLSVENSAASILAAQTEEVEVISGVDFTKAESWFPAAPAKKIKESKITHYLLSIPKLKIDNASTRIGGNDLNKGLIHYGGTALPGEYGNIVIFGHSVLPIFYNPKDYHTIFSLLPTLEKGDEIYIDYDGIQYKYIVDSYFEVKPEDIEVLEQRFDRQALTLITCVPPGTYLKRGIIKAYLTKL